MNGKVEDRMTQEAIYADFERLQKSYDEKIECLAIMCAINEKLVKILNERMYIPAGGSNPLLWSVEDVCDFVKNLPGCQEYADEFKSHEIDGQALMLLKEDHLMNMMNMKLGPALKICSRINALFKTESPKPQE